MAREGGAPSMRMVAEGAGVSVATVSNVLNGKRSVAPEIGQRVRAAVERLGYVRDNHASRLRSGKSKLAGLIVPDLANPMFAAFVSIIEHLARLDGYDLVVVSSRNDPVEEADRVRQVREWRPAGLIVIPCDGALAARLPAGFAMPLVVADRIPDAARFDLVAVDNAASAAAVVRHLGAQGYSGCLVAGTSLGISNVRERWEGAVSGGASMDLELIEVGFDDRAPALLQDRVTAVRRPAALFCLDHETTLAAWRLLGEIGLRPGEDIAFASFDEMEWMRLVSPAVTAVRQPVEEMAECAWATFRRRIGGDTSARTGPAPALRHHVPRIDRAETRLAPARGQSNQNRRTTPMTITRRTLLATTAGGLAASLLPVGIAFAQADAQIGIVVKIGGIPWFNAMEQGIKKEADEIGTNAWMVGPTQADAAQQVRAIEDLIARKVSVIGIVPNDSAALAPVLGRANEAGIKVLSHEGPDQENRDWDFELTTIEAYGQAHMDLLAKEMGETGEYIVYVGSLTVPLHNAWADAAIAYQKQTYPNMTMLGDRFGVAESVDDSIKTTQDQLRAHPDLTGILTFGSQGPIGAARVLEDREVADKVVLVGGFSPGQGAKYVKSGTIRGGFIWNPMTAGEIFVQLGEMLAQGEEPNGRDGAGRRRAGEGLSGQEADPSAEARVARQGEHRPAGRARTLSVPTRPPAACGRRRSS